VVRLGVLAVWLLVLAPPFLLVPEAKEAFRLPKLMACEWLALASLLFLSWQLREVEVVGWTGLWRRPAVRAVLPVLLVATVSLATTAHPLHAREGLIDLWIGAAALVGWSLGLSTARLEALLRGLLWPAAGLALFGILQFHGLFQPLQFSGISFDPRLAMTSTAGNPGDLGGCLVLPCLVAQWTLARGVTGWARWATAASLALSTYALALTQTLASLAALAVGSLVLWALVLPARRIAWALGGGAAVALILVLAVPPLRSRVLAKTEAARQGDWNAVLTGRLDGWRAAVWMLREHPWTGVGQGAFRPEFVPAKLALLERGTAFYAPQVTPVFGNAHNDWLEAGADWGIPGLAAVAWGLWTLGAALRRQPAGPARAFAFAAAAALAVLALGYFPFRIALIAWPALLALAWMLRLENGAEEPRKDGRGLSGRLLAWPLALVLLLALAGQTARWRARVTAGRLLHRVELLTMAAASRGGAPRGLLSANLDTLRRAAALDPLEVGVPIARGSQYLLFGNLGAARESYEAAAALEPRPEIYLNLGRTALAAGRPDEARRWFALCVRIDPRMALSVPAAMR
jgi:O-antigen ligase